jgi:predicted lipoprotein with Yx(FWY)xxD motif
MRNQRRARIQQWTGAAGLIATALALSACGATAGGASAGYASNSAASNSAASNSAASNSAASTSAGQTSGASTTATIASLRTERTSAGTVLASGSGLTLYYDTADKRGSGKSACSGSCAITWPPLVAPVTAPAGVRMPGPLGTLTRTDGVRQVTINGYPIYTYSGDRSPGQVDGNGIARTWHAIRVHVAAASLGGLMEVQHTPAGSVLANPHGMTVYYYSADKPGSGKSTCTGTCVLTWPPVIAPVRIPVGVELPGAVGFIVRPGGVRQVTIDGAPIYRYAGDHAPGESNGNGVAGEWHVIIAITAN